MKLKSKSFTLAETLVTLVIIGIVAALTIPNLVSKYEDHQFKSAYKKAYSEAYQAFQLINRDGEFIPITQYPDSTYGENFKKLILYIKPSKTCFYPPIYKADSCFVCLNTETGFPSGMTDENYKNIAPCNYQQSFIDVSGRAWLMYTNYEHPFIVDENGAKGPNKLGKDRYPFSMGYYSNGILNVKDGGINSWPNQLTSNRWCPSGDCYYSDWLQNKK